MSLAAGARLGPYELVAPIGEGGMGEVWRARDTRLSRDVAVKTLPQRLAGDPALIARFEREAQAVAALSHPGILAIHDFGRAVGPDGTPVVYAVTELLEGESLADRLATGPLSPRRATEIAREVALALAAAHERGIVHRDLKPANLFLLRDGRVKVLDFGLAKQAVLPRGGDASSAPTVREMTEAGAVLGTVGYMSPEQVRGEPVDARADLFALGAVLFEMLAGRRAFHRSSPAETLSAILRDDPPEPAETGRSLPPALDRIVRRCLEKDPSARFGSARDLAFALEAIGAASGAIEASPASSRPGRRVSRRVAAALLALLGAFLLLAVGVRLGRRSAGPPSPRFTRLTSRTGSVLRARFAPDGKTVFFGAAFGDSPTEIWSIRDDGTDLRRIGIPKADLYGVSATNELAVQRKSDFLTAVVGRGTLARVPGAGGAPRDVAEGTYGADWLPDGSGLAVVRSDAVGHRLEFPVGNPVLRGGCWWPRVSPDGALVACFTPAEAGGESITLVDRKGKTREIAGPFFSRRTLAWEPDGSALVVSSPGKAGGPAAVFRVPLRGKSNLLFRGADDHLVADVGRDGRLLVVRSILRNETWVRTPSGLRDATWQMSAEPVAFSADGSRLLFAESGAMFGSPVAAWIRDSATDDLPVRLADGDPADLSADGTLALVTGADPAELLLVPAGPGEVRRVRLSAPYGPRPKLALGGKGIVAILRGEEADSGTAVLKPIDGVERALTGEVLRPAWPFVVDRVGSRAVFVRPEGGLVVVDLVAGTSRTVPAELSPRENLFLLEEEAVFVASGGELPLRLARISLADGSRTQIETPAELRPLRGVLRGNLVANGDLSVFALEVRRSVAEDLFLVDRSAEPRMAGPRR